ncbi:testis-expressed protein 47 [Clinocottus analis]|uniref:testis-expressed protein 47 n=1 Tax=Clinocottus analis TaxID=304258 RepID=UPI0035C2483B
MADQRSFSLLDTDSREEEEGEAEIPVVGIVIERIVLQRLILIARLPLHLADRTELGVHYEKLHLQLSEQFIMDPMTGLLLVYPSCLLHVIESSRDVLVSVLENMQQQPEGVFMEAAKLVFMAHDPESRLFPQWSYKVLDADERAVDYKGLGEEESTESLVCSVLTALQTLGEPTSEKAGSGSALDESPEPLVSESIIYNLLTRDELLTPQQYLQMYNTPMNIHMNAGRDVRSRCLTTI